jgi:hypothetical protein
MILGPAKKESTAVKGIRCNSRVYRWDSEMLGHTTEGQEEWILYQITSMT